MSDGSWTELTGRSRFQQKLTVKLTAADVNRTQTFRARDLASLGHSGPATGRVQIRPHETVHCSRPFAAEQWVRNEPPYLQHHLVESWDASQCGDGGDTTENDSQLDAYFVFQFVQFVVSQCVFHAVAPAMVIRPFGAIRERTVPERGIWNSESDCRWEVSRSIRMVSELACKMDSACLARPNGLIETDTTSQYSEWAQQVKDSTLILLENERPFVILFPRNKKVLSLPLEFDTTSVDQVVHLPVSVLQSKHIRNRVHVRT